MVHMAALVEVFEGGVNLPKLPLFGLNKTGDCLSAKRRLRSLRTPRQYLQAFLRIAIEANRENLCHRLSLIVHNRTRHLAITG